MLSTGVKYARRKFFQIATRVVGYVSLRRGLLLHTLFGPCDPVWQHRLGLTTHAWQLLVIRAGSSLSLHLVAQMVAPCNYSTVDVQCPCEPPAWFDNTCLVTFCYYSNTRKITSLPSPLRGGVVYLWAPFTGSPRKVYFNISSLSGCQVPNPKT